MLGSGLFYSFSITQECVLNQIPLGGLALLTFLNSNWILSFAVWGKTRLIWQVLSEVNLRIIYESSQSESHFL